jgi:hypothetical protein
MKANYLNQAFDPAQVRAIEKYVAAALAAGIRTVELPAPAVAAEKKPTRAKPSLSEELVSSSPAPKVEQIPGAVSKLIDEQKDVK